MEHTDLTLPRDIYYQVAHTLRASLPPPVTDTPEDLARRDNAAIAQVASLLPANADEANLAAQYVAAGAQALDCLRLVRENPADSSFALRCAAQAASMMRQARGARSLLLNVQARRQKREADNASLDRAGWIEHSAFGLMADALARTPSATAKEPRSTATRPELRPDPAAEAAQSPVASPPRIAGESHRSGWTTSPPTNPPEPVRESERSVRSQPDPTQSAGSPERSARPRPAVVRHLGRAPASGDFGSPFASADTDPPIDSTQRARDAPADASAA